MKKLTKSKWAFLLYIHFQIYYLSSICFDKILCFCSSMMFVFFCKYNTRQSGSDNRTNTIKTWFIGTIDCCSFYSYSFSGCPDNSIHLSMNLVFIWPFMMIFCILSFPVIMTVYIPCRSSIISRRDDSSIFDYNSSSFARDALRCWGNLISNPEKINIA